jgi:hypothetical protein
MRSIALDVHRGFCEVAIKEKTKLRSGGRIKTSVAELELFAKSLAADDQVALEASGPALAIKRILEPHVGRVVVANTRKVRAIAEAKVKTDKVDAARSASCSTRAFCPPSSAPASGRDHCAGACSAARSSCARGRGQRTSCTRFWRAISKGARP